MYGFRPLPYFFIKSIAERIARIIANSSLTVKLNKRPGLIAVLCFDFLGLDIVLEIYR